MKVSEFLEQFLLHPTVAEVNEGFLWKQSEHPFEITDKKYDGEKMAARGFRPILREYFKHLDGKAIPAEVAELLIQCAQAFAQRGYGHCEWVRNVDAQIESMRLMTLIDNPIFLSDECAVPVLHALKDLRYCEPWNFEMFATYDHHDRTGYHLRWGFGERNIAGFHRIILCEDLWTGKSSEMRRVFFSSVGQALRLMAQDRGLLLETLQPRIDLLKKNQQYGGAHEPWCNTSFREDELAAICQLVETDERARIVLAEIDAAPYTILYPHWC